MAIACLQLDLIRGLVFREETRECCFVFYYWFIFYLEVPVEIEVNNDKKAGFLVDKNQDEKAKAKSANRIHYEAQVLVIKKQLGGDLEKVRLDLGLSQRKMAQLLMVDPSAWTRWTKLGEQAPPMVYRALQWYMTLNEKIPGLTPQYFIGRQWASESAQAWENERMALVESKIKLEMELQYLKEKMQLMDQKIAELGSSRLPATRGARKAKKSTVEGKASSFFINKFTSGMARLLKKRDK